MRYCRYCSKQLPAKTSRQRFFCPEEPGKPRCRDLARKLILKGKGNPDLLLKNFHRFAPRGAAGFRLRLVQGNYTWTGPRLGIRNHKNATGAMRQGDFYFLDEKPRVPRTEDYFIDYVDASGALVLPLERAPLVRLQATEGTFRDTPSETMRNKIKCLDSGRPLPPARKRVFELARDLGLMAQQLLRELPRLGIPCGNVQNSLGQEQIDLVLRHYTGRLFGPGGGNEKEGRPEGLTASRAMPPIGPSRGPGSQGDFSTLPLDECLPVPSMIRPEHDAAHAYAKGIIASAGRVENEALGAIKDQFDLAASLGREVDRLAGVTQEEPKDGG